jgi:hypothetical protein
MLNVGPNSILEVFLGCVLNHPPILLQNLDLKASSTAMFAKSVVDTPPEGSILFPLDDSQDLLLCLLVILLLGCSEASEKMFPLIQLPMFPELITPLDTGYQVGLDLL